MIEEVTNQNIEDVLPLIKEYQIFYGVEDIDEEKNREFFPNSRKIMEMVFSIYIKLLIKPLALLQFIKVSQVLGLRQLQY